MSAWPKLNSQLRLSILVCLTISVTCHSSGHADSLTDCDRLAANGYDTTLPEYVHVDRDKIQIEAALQACWKAIQQNPNVGRFYYEYGRAYQNRGDMHPAIVSFKKAAELGHVVAMDSISEMPASTLLSEKEKFDYTSKALEGHLAILKSAVAAKPSPFGGTVGRREKARISRLMKRLADSYEQGTGVDKDIGKANQLRQQAKELDDQYQAELAAPSTNDGNKADARPGITLHCYLDSWGFDIYIDLDKQVMTVDAWRYKLIKETDEEFVGLYEESVTERQDGIDYDSRKKRLTINRRTAAAFQQMGLTNPDLRARNRWKIVHTITGSCYKTAVQQPQRF